MRTLTGTPALIATLVYLTFIVYNLYFLYRVAVTVHAWPFG